MYLYHVTEDFVPIVQERLSYYSEPILTPYLRNFVEPFSNKGERSIGSFLGRQQNVPTCDNQWWSAISDSWDRIPLEAVIAYDNSSRVCFDQTLSLLPTVESRNEKENEDTVSSQPVTVADLSHKDPHVFKYTPGHRG